MNRLATQSLIYGGITLPTGYALGIYQKLIEYWAPMISALLL
jgi:hypothetical protein